MVEIQGVLVRFFDGKLRCFGGVWYEGEPRIALGEVF